MKKIALLALTLAALGSSMSASAQFAKNEHAIEYRQGALFIIGQHMGRLGAMVKGTAPYDAKAAVENAQVIADMARLPWAGFIPGTETKHAKPNIWTEGAKFKEGQDKMMAESAKLLTASKVGNLDTLKAAFGDLGKSCKSCHDSFKKD